VLDAIIWALKHTMRHVADTGLGILYQLLQNVAATDAAAQSFYQTYYVDILQHLFSVVTDSSHTAGYFNTSQQRRGPKKLGEGGSCKFPAEEIMGA